MSRYSNTATRFRKAIYYRPSVYRRCRRFSITSAGAHARTPIRAHAITNVFTYAAAYPHHHPAHGRVAKETPSLRSGVAMRPNVLARGAAPPGPLPAAPVRRGSHHRGLVNHRPWLPPASGSAVPLPFLWGNPRPIARLGFIALTRSSGGAPQSKFFSNPSNARENPHLTPLRRCS